MPSIRIEAAEEIKTLFSRQPSRFKFEKLLNSNNGVVMIVRERLANGTLRRFVVKAPADYPEEWIRNEAMWVQRLQYALHVSNSIYLTNNPLEPLKAPYFITEYLAHGTLRQFQERTNRADQPLPNRIMWSIFVCLMRSCIAMAYHPRGPYVQIEDVRDEEPSNLAHNDMHGDNLVFGTPDNARLLSVGGTMYLQEHAFLPPLKLIDFGLASEVPPSEAEDIYEDNLNQHDHALGLANHRQNTGRRNEGIDFNLLDIGVVMARVISGRESGALFEARGWARDLTIRPDLDPELRLLTQRCLAVDPANRPRLEELNRMINQGRFNKTAASYGAAGQGSGLESDAMLKHIVYAYILSADTT